MEAVQQRGGRREQKDILAEKKQWQLQKRRIQRWKRSRSTLD
jgi:hypothetical protein